MVDIPWKHSSDAREVLSDWDKLIKKEVQAALKANGITEATKKAGKAGKNAFGSRARRQIKDMATAYLGVQGALGLVRAGVSSVTSALRENQRALDENIAGFARFSALGTLSKKDRSFLLGAAGKLLPTTASELGFAAKSAEFTQAQTRALFKEAGFAKRLGEDPSVFGRSIVALKEGVLSKKTIPQISSFLATQAAASPLSSSEFAAQFTKIGGVAGLTDPEKSAGGALASAIIKALGASAEPARATTAARAFLIKRQLSSVAARKERATGGLPFEGGDIGEFLIRDLRPDKFKVPKKRPDFIRELDVDEFAITPFGFQMGKEGTKGFDFLKSLGVESADVPSQIEALSKAALEPGFDKQAFFKAFGEETGAPLLALLLSPKAVSRIREDTEAGVRALGVSGRSVIERKFKEKIARDPEFRFASKSADIVAIREQEKVKRGFAQASLEAGQQETLLELERESLGTGSALVGGGKRFVSRASKAALLNPFLAGTLAVFEAVKDFTTPIEENLENVKIQKTGPIADPTFLGEESGSVDVTNQVVGLLTDIKSNSDNPGLNKIRPGSREAQ